MFKTIRIIAIGFVVLAALAGIGFGIQQSIAAQAQNTIYLAVAGPMSGSLQSYGEEMLRGVNLYVQQVNSQRGIQGKKIKVLPVDDLNSPEQARIRAQEIVNSPAVVVIGHAYSSTSLAAGEIYQKAGPAAISGSATTDRVTDNYWFFRSVANNRSQAVLLGNYISKILNYHTAGVIFDQDEYGTSLATAFESAFNEAGGQLLYQKGFDAAVADLDTQLQTIVDELKNLPEPRPEIIFLAIHKPQAEQLLTKIRAAGLNYPLMCSEAMGDPTFAADFANLPAEEATPGFYTNGVYTVTPILYPIAGRLALQLQDASLKTYGVAPGWKTATYYDAAMLAVEAIRRAGPKNNGETIAAYRQRVRDQLAGINSLEKSVSGVTGNLYFDENRNITVPMIISIFQNRYLLSAMEQVQVVKNLQAITDLPDEIAKGSLLNFDQRYFYRTNVVYTGLDFMEISNLDMKNSTFVADFYLWLRYRGELDKNRIEFVNALNPLTLGEPLAQAVKAGVTYQVFRVKSTFKADLDFSDYPFDRQILSIRLRHNSATRDRLIFMPDIVGMRYTSSQAAIDRIQATDALKSLSNWPLDSIRYFQEVLKYDSTLGNPDYFDSNTEIEYSGFNAEIAVHRDVLRFAMKNFIPLILLIIISYTAFLFSADQLGQRFGLGTGPLLTTAFFHMSLSNSLPQIGYVVAMEYVFYGIYVLYLVIIITAFISYVAYDKKKFELARDLNWAGAIIFEAIILVGIILLDHFYQIVR